MSKILIVDDEAIIRDFVRIALERAGHITAEARNGREAMKLFDTFEPDCVITDLIMPEQEGLETIIKLRQQPRRVRIVAITGGFHPLGPVFLKTAGELGADTVLSKPFSVHDLLVAVDPPRPGQKASDAAQDPTGGHD